jgi:hypothetical protein
LRRGLDVSKRWLRAKTTFLDASQGGLGSAQDPP